MQDNNKLPTSKVQLVEISADLAGQRIDNFLMCRLKGVPRSKVYNIVRKGEVRVNKGRIKPEYRLQQGDLVRIPPVRLPEKKEAEKPANRVLAQLKERIIYEDNKVLVLNKPSGIAVHGGSGLNYGVIEALRILRPDCKQLELVHRLDRDTSGCLLLAKKRSALRYLHEQLRQGKVDKRYLALIKGKWHGPARWVDAPLLKNVVSSGERIVRVDKSGKSARTEFSPYAVSDMASLMKIKLDTGRTHQIRVHAQHVSHPLAGDEKYGDDDFNRALRKLGLKRLFLHAHSLRFRLSDETKAQYVEAPLDEDLLNILEKLNLSL